MNTVFLKNNSKKYTFLQEEEEGDDGDDDVDEKEGRKSKRK